MSSQSSYTQSSSQSSSHSSLPSTQSSTQPTITAASASASTTSSTAAQLRRKKPTVNVNVNAAQKARQQRQQSQSSSSSSAITSSSSSADDEDADDAMLPQEDALVPANQSSAITTAAVSVHGLPQVQYTLKNIVATMDLGCKIECKTIALKCRNAEYNPKRFSAVIMRIREPKVTSLIFASGKVVVTGAKSENDSRLGARKIARIVQKCGFEVRYQGFKVQNVVGTADLKFPIRLEGLSVSHADFCSYEPELFPGLVYRMMEPKVVLLIFVSGKVVLTGAKTQEDIAKAFSQIYPVLLGFKKTSSSS